MTKELLKNKTARYLCGQSVPAEKLQIQTWLSCTDNKIEMSAEERRTVENEIVTLVNAYTASSLFTPKQGGWWQKFTAMF